MSVVPVWSLFAYFTGDAEGENDERRALAEWQVADAIRWCVSRGYDNIHLSRDPIATTSFRKSKPVEGVKHHGFDDGGSAA